MYIHFHSTSSHMKFRQILMYTFFFLILVYSLKKICYDITCSNTQLNIKINWNILLSSRLKCVWLNWCAALWRWIMYPSSCINNCSPLGLCMPWYVTTTFLGDSLVFILKHRSDKEPGESNLKNFWMIFWLVITAECHGASPAKHFSGLCQVIIQPTRTMKTSFLVKVFFV